MERRKERSLKTEDLRETQMMDVRDVIYDLYALKNSCQFGFVKGCLKETEYLGYQAKFVAENDKNIGISIQKALLQKIIVRNAANCVGVHN